MKGEIVRRGVETITGLTMPVFEKRRFQHGAVNGEGFARLFPVEGAAYREAFAEMFV